MVDSREVGCVCIYSSRVKCLTPEWVHYYRNTKETEMTKLPLLYRICYMGEISYFDRKTHTGPEHKNHELIPFRRLVLLHYSRFGRYEVSSVVSKVKVWNPASAVTNFMESPLCRDLKTNDSDMVFSFFLERDGPWLLSNLGGFFFFIIKN